MENIYKGFKVEGTTEEIKKLNQLIEDKKLTREDLTLITKTMERNKRNCFYWELKRYKRRKFVENWLYLWESNKKSC